MARSGSDSDADSDTDGFLSRWSRRKVQVQQGMPAKPEPARPAATVTPPGPPDAAPAPATAAAAETRDHPPQAPDPALPTLEEAQRLTTADDFSRFVGRGVDPQVKNTALRTLFSDPHFNVMDGLDTYIDDYGKPDPLPPGMLRNMAQSAMLRLFDDEPEDAKVDNPPAVPGCSPAAATAIPATPPHTPPDEDTALRLQPHNDAGHAGDHPGACEDAGRQH
jgi:hypothetical protein